MPGRLSQPREGEGLTKTSGFPLFFETRRPRIITADPWAFLEYLAASPALKQAERAKVLAFVEQAYDYYQAASNPQLGSKPALYYYSFLNVVKAFLIMRGIDLPLITKHGMHYPKENIKQRFRLEGQELHVSGPARDRSLIFPELLRALGGRRPQGGNIRVVDLLAQIPAIHRTFTQVTGHHDVIVPIKSLILLRKSGEVWCQLRLEKHDPAVRRHAEVFEEAAEFVGVFTRVASSEATEMCFQTQAIQSRGRTRNVDFAVQRVAAWVRSLPITTILTHDGYKYYFNCMDRKQCLPQMAASVAAMFYFGCITRYQPAYFDRIRAGKYGWVCEELLATQPTQLLYILCSELAGVDVVRPHTLLE